MNWIVGFVIFWIVTAAAPVLANVAFDLHAGIRQIETGLLLKNPNLKEAYGGDTGFHLEYHGSVVPFSLGVGITRQDFQLNKELHYFDHLTFENRDIRLSYNSPIQYQAGIFSPLVHLAYTWSGRAQGMARHQTVSPMGRAEDTRFELIQWELATSGIHVAVGGQISVSKRTMLSLVLDYGQMRGDTKSLKTRSGGESLAVESPPLEKIVIKSKGLLLGGRFEF